jgi:hypothetical protein
VVDDDPAMVRELKIFVEVDQHHQLLYVSGKLAVPE